jgi:hypothetical protein
LRVRVRKPGRDSAVADGSAWTCNEPAPAATPLCGAAAVAGPTAFAAGAALAVPAAGGVEALGAGAFGAGVEEHAASSVANAGRNQLRIREFPFCIKLL